MYTCTNCQRQLVNKMSLNELKDKVINWHMYRYPGIDNTPAEKSLNAINRLCSDILFPIQDEFGAVKITYGFTSHTLLKNIQKLSPNHIAPNLDQHASYELNSRGNSICTRGGAACDIFVPEFETNMYVIAKWAADNLPFDRMYLYGSGRPIHLSFGPDNMRFIQVMKTSTEGKRFPGKRGTYKEFATIIGDVDEI